MICQLGLCLFMVFGFRLVMVVVGYAYVLQFALNVVVYLLYSNHSLRLYYYFGMFVGALFAGCLEFV